jgi:hypothetical protein
MSSVYEAMTADEPLTTLVLKAIGVWTGVAGRGDSLGMYLSAGRVHLASWRRLFVLPVVLVAVAMALRCVLNSREQSAHGFDLIGSLTSAVAVLGLTACSTKALNRAGMRR